MTFAEFRLRLRAAWRVLRHGHRVMNLVVLHAHFNVTDMDADETERMAAAAARRAIADARHVH
jgi:hypothetical protein